MKRLAAIAALVIGLSGLAAPAMAAESIPADQVSQLNDAPVDPSPSHHKIKPPAPGKHGDLWLLFHGGFKDSAPATNGDTSATDVLPAPHTAVIMIKSGLTVAKVAKAKALKQPKVSKTQRVKAAKQAAQPKPAKQPKAAKTPKPAKQPKVAKATTVKPPPGPAQTQLYGYFNPRQRVVKH